MCVFYLHNKQSTFFFLLFRHRMQVFLAMTSVLLCKIWYSDVWSRWKTLCVILFWPVSTAWSTHRSVATWVARFGEMQRALHACSVAISRVHVAGIVYLYTVHNALRHAHAQQVNWEGWRPKHSWWVSCGGRQGHRWTRNQRGRMEARREMGKRWRGWRKDEEGERDSFPSSSHVRTSFGPRFFCVCMDAASLPMSSLSLSTFCWSNSRNWQQLFIKVLSPSTVKSVAVWRAVCAAPAMDVTVH